VPLGFHWYIKLSNNILDILVPDSEFMPNSATFPFLRLTSVKITFSSFKVSSSKMDAEFLFVVALQHQELGGKNLLVCLY